MTNDERLARAVQAINEAYADLLICAMEARNTDEALTIATESGKLSLHLAHVENVALGKADAACGETLSVASGLSC